MNQIEEYRDALDGLRFSEEGKERIKQNLLEQAEQPVKEKHFRTMRAALIAAVLSLALVGTAMAAKELFGSWVVNIEHDGGYYTQQAYSNVKHFTTDDLCDGILWSPIGESNWGIGKNSWEEMEEYLEYPLMSNTVMANSPKIMCVRDGIASVCDITVNYFNDKNFSYTKAGRDMSPYADDLKYVMVQSTSVVDGLWVSVIGMFYTERFLQESSCPLPMHGEEFSAGTLSEYALSDGTEAVVYRPSQITDSDWPVVWFTYEGVLYYVNFYVEDTTPFDEVDWDCIIYKILDGFTV